MRIDSLNKKQLESESKEALIEMVIDGYNECTHWRQWFLETNHVTIDKVRMYLLSYPAKSFIKKCPEKILIECLIAAWNED